MYVLFVSQMTEAECSFGCTVRLPFSLNIRLEPKWLDVRPLYFPNNRGKKKQMGCEIGLWVSNKRVKPNPVWKEKGSENPKNKMGRKKKTTKHVKERWPPSSSRIRPRRGRRPRTAALITVRRIVALSRSRPCSLPSPCRVRDRSCVASCRPFVAVACFRVWPLAVAFVAVRAALRDLGRRRLFVCCSSSWEISCSLLSATTILLSLTFTVFWGIILLLFQT